MFKNYNYSIFDIHNYDNFNYIYNYISSETLFDQKTYLNYIFFNTSLKDINNNKEETINKGTNILKLNNNSFENILFKDYNQLNYQNMEIFFLLIKKEKKVYKFWNMIMMKKNFIYQKRN